MAMRWIGPRHVLWGWCLGLIWSVVAVPAAAQTLRGRVRAPDGAPLPGVNVVVPALERGTVTDADGAYRLDDLPADTLTVRFSYVGFEPAERRADLRRGDARLDVTLREAVVAADEVIVAADAQGRLLERASQSTSVLERAELEALRGQSFADMLEALPGVSTLSTGPSISKPVVRGLHSQRLLLLQAGVPQEGQQWGGEHAPEIDPFAPGTVEVVRGAAGVEYGVGAIGGVIRVEPRELPHTPGIGGQALLSGFSNNRQGAGSLLVEGGVGGLPGVGWRMQGSLRRAGDSRTPDYVVGNSAFSETSLNAALGYHRGPLGLDAYVSRFQTELGLFRGAHINNLADLLRAIERGEPAVAYDFSYDIDAPKQRVTHDLVSLRGHLRLPAGDVLTLKYGFQHNERQEFDAHRGGQALDGAEPSFDLDLITHSAEAKWSHRPVGAWFGSAGVSLMNQANRNVASGFLIPNFRAVTGGAFVHETWVQGRWTVDAGLRYDLRWLRAWPYDRGTRAFEKTVNTYQSVSGVLGVIVRPAEAWSVAANVGTAWRPPGVNELYSDGVHHGTAQYELGDPDLGAERSLDASLTLRRASARWEGEVSAYRNRMDDFIYLRPAPEPTVTIRGVYPTFTYEQTDAVLAGLDGHVDVRVQPWLEVGADASVLRADDRSAGTPLYGMPANRLGLHARTWLPETSVVRTPYLDLTLHRVLEQDRVPDGLDYAPPPKGYARVDVQAGAALRLGGTEARASLAVENVFDTAYRDYLSRFRYFIDAPGRNVVFRLQIPFGRYTP